MQRPIARKQKNFFSRTVFYFILLSFFGAIVYIAAFSPYLEITKIDIQGNQDIPAEKIKSDLDSLLAGKYLNAISKNNLIFCKENKMEEKLLENYRKMRAVEIERNFPATLTVKITERQLEMAIKSGENTYLLDENGQAYDIYSPETYPDILMLNDESGKEISLGGYPLEIGYMRYLLDLRDNLKNNLEIEIENEIRTPSIVSNYVIAKSKGSWDIYFNLDIPLEKEIGVLGVALAEKIEKSQQENLEYLDLRVNNKIFYKFKEGTEQEKQVVAQKEESIKADKNKEDNKKKK